MRHLIKGLAVFAILAVLGIAALWLEHRTNISLPEPTGAFAVGRALFDWRDDPATKRELLVWLWYPAQPGAVLDDYVPSSVRVPAGRARRSLFSLLTRDLSKVHGHSLRNAAMSPQQRSYPVVIMRTGASAPVMNYSTLAEDLASHGYVVVGFDAPYRTGLVVFPDGRVIARTPENNPELYSGKEFTRVAEKLLAAWIADMAFVLDRLERLNASGQFAGRLDMSRVGVFGHSFGGAQALQFCHDDARCKAGIDIDGAPLGSVIQTGLHQPFMFLLSDHGDLSSDAEGRQIMANIRSIYDRLPPNGRVLLMIRGANHFTFSDDGALLKSHVLRAIFRLFGKLGIDGRRQLVVTAHCVHSFFDAELNGASISQITPSPPYPEIRALQ